MNGGYAIALWLKVIAVAVVVRAAGAVSLAVIVIGLTVITGSWTAGGVIV
jgi:hypothetical protein